MSNRKELTDELRHAIRAKVPIITIESFEWERVVGVIAAVARMEEQVYLRWNNERGLMLYDTASRDWVDDDEIIRGMNGWDIASIISWFSINIYIGSMSPWGSTNADSHYI